MTQSSNELIFIDETPRGKSSNSNKSIINAQVATYAHQQRRNVLTKTYPSSILPRLLSVSRGGGSVREYTSSNQASNRTSCKIYARVRSVQQRAASVRSEKGGNRLSEANDERQRIRDDCHGAGKMTRWAALKDIDVRSLYETLMNPTRITRSPDYQPWSLSLDHQGRHLAQFWLTEVIKAVFGLSAVRYEVSILESLSRYTFNFPGPLRWIMARSALNLHMKTGSCSLSIVYRYRQEALKALQTILTSKKVSVDELLGSLEFAIVHDLESQQVHLYGLDTLIESRGGLQSIFKGCKVTQPHHVILMYSFGIFNIATVKQLKSLKKQFFQALSSVRDVAKEVRWLRSQIKCEQLAHEQTTVDVSSAELSKEVSYIEQWDRVFGPSSSMGQLIGTKLEVGTSLMIQARFFAALIQLGVMITQHEDIEQKQRFLKQLEESADVLLTFSMHSVTGSPKIEPGAAVYMIGHVDRKVREQDFGDESYEKSVVPSVISIAGLKLHGLLSDVERRELRELIQDWLTDSEEFDEGVDKLNSLSIAMTQSWQQQNCLPKSC